ARILYEGRDVGDMGILVAPDRGGDGRAGDGRAPGGPTSKVNPCAPGGPPRPSTGRKNRNTYTYVTGMAAKRPLLEKMTGYTRTVITSQGREMFQVLLEVEGTHWVARIVTLPNRVWFEPGGRAALKFFGASCEGGEMGGASLTR